MSTNLTEVSFSESANTLNVRVISSLSGGSNNVEADELEMMEYGVMVRRTVSTTRTTYFIPYSNIASIEQTETV